LPPGYCSQNADDAVFIGDLFHLVTSRAGMSCHCNFSRSCDGSSSRGSSREIPLLMQPA
jgi:hypothetical protein